MTFNKKTAFALFAGSLGLASLSCDESGGTETPDMPSRRMLVANLATNVMLPNYRDFHDKAMTLDAATSAYASDQSPTNLQAAQQAWRDAMTAFARTEAHTLGPAGMNISQPGGMDLRDEIYAWPLLNKCRIDQTTTMPAHASKTDIAALAINVRGLGAIEYLLFTDTTDNACTPQTDINTNGVWTGLGATEVTRRRAVYAQAAASIVRDKAAQLVMAWDTTGGNFVTSISTAGAGSSHFSTAQAALNAVSDAMLVIDYIVKDMKLGKPAAIVLGCASTTCPDMLESPVARFSKDEILANLRSFRELYTGATTSSGYGFDDLLVEVGAQALSTQILNDLDAAIAAVEAITGSLEEALATGNDAGRAQCVTAFNAVKAVSDVLKTEFLTVLDLQLPSRLEGDND